MIKIENFSENQELQNEIDSAADEPESHDTTGQGVALDDDNNHSETQVQGEHEEHDELEATDEVETSQQQVSAESFQLENQKGIIEALIFASSEPITLNQLVKTSQLTKTSVEQIITELNSDYLDSGRTFRIEQVAGGYRMFTLPEYHSYINQAGIIERTQKLSQAALESLAVIAYKQPITRAEIERLRGVDCGGVLKNLMSKDLIVIDGRSDAPGKPILYRTSSHFLEFFGLPSLDHLPQLSEVDDSISIPRLTLLREGEGEDNGDNPEAEVDPDDEATVNRLSEDIIVESETEDDLEEQVEDFEESVERKE